MPRLIFLLQVDMPPLKKRRGLAGSIVNTAVSAALIGTAVGLTVYRMWRDRGKDDQPHLLEGPSASIVESDSEDSSLTDSASHPPPPPYSLAVAQPPAVRVEHHGTPSKGKSRGYSYTSGADNTSSNNSLSLPPTTTTTTTTTPATTPRKRRREIQAAKRPVALVPRHRRQGSKGTAAASSGLNSNAGSQPGTSTRSEFDFGYEGALNGKQEEEGEEEDQMDWIGGKLAELIAQGQRALNTEVVVMSEAREDEVDDGSGAWGSDEEEHKRKPLSRAGSVRSVKRGSRPMPIGVPTYTGVTSSYQSPPSTSTSVSYASASAGFVPSASVSSFSSGSVRGFAYESSASTTPYQTPYQAQAEREDPASWESPLVQESMERARARLMARRTGGV